LEKFKEFNKEIIFTEEELLLEEQKYQELFEEENQKEEIKEQDIDEIEKIKKEAHLYVLNKCLDKFKNSYIMEKTPLGNVAMCYNHAKGSFEYYSENTIPYRYLETVSRKYVMTFQCKNLYIDMNIELQNAITKKELKEKEKEKEKEEKELKTKDNQLKTKDIFAKFKSNNRETISRENLNLNVVNKGKNSKQMYTNTNTKNQSISNDKYIIKENANRYTHSGKFANLNFLKKIDRKVVDKNYALSYKDFIKAKLESSKIL
jgi:hypothetical protein